MKNNATTTILNWLLAASLLFSAICFVQYFFWTREQRSLRGKVVAYQVTHTTLNLLVNEAMDYSKRNPTILPILETIGVKQAQTAPAGTNKPAGK
jgi:RecB family endonuclease NucS